MPLSNPTTRNEYIHSLRSVFCDVRQIAKQQLNKVSKKRAGHKQGTKTWRPFHEGQTVMLRRPKGWKFSSKWVRPYRIIKRLGVNHKIISRGGVEKVVHHDQLKLSYVPFQPGKLGCPTREVGEFQVVDVAPQEVGNPIMHRELKTSHRRTHASAFSASLQSTIMAALGGIGGTEFSLYLILSEN